LVAASAVELGVAKPVTLNPPAARSVLRVPETIVALVTVADETVPPLIVGLVKILLVRVCEPVVVTACTPPCCRVVGFTVPPVIVAVEVKVPLRVAPAIVGVLIVPLLIVGLVKVLRVKV